MGEKPQKEGGKKGGGRRKMREKSKHELDELPSHNLAKGVQETPKCI